MVATEQTGNDPLINQTIEGYEIIQQLGEGTYGLVYLARHPRIKQRLVAVKYIKVTNPVDAEKVEREIDILAQFNHGNIVQIYDTFRFEHYRLIVMELVSGGSLRESQKQLNGLLDLRFVVEGIQQLAFALAYVHEKNILHLDLKPGNILLDPVNAGQTTRFVLTDFGIARFVGPNLSMSTNIIGTPMYMSPEHFGFGDAKPDHRSDIYSLGVILYEMIVGHVPFQSNQLLDLLNQHAYELVTPPSHHIPDLPPQLDTIILRSMAKLPQDRYQSAAEMGQELHELLITLLADPQRSLRGRVPGQALGAIAQAGANALEIVNIQHPAPKAEAFQLVVMKPDGSQEIFTFDKDSVIAGRDASHVDLHLDQKTISRQHIKINRDGNNIYITDLQSVNGSYLDGSRLSPQERKQWYPGQYVQIQGFLLQLGNKPVAGEQAIPPTLATGQVVSLLDKVAAQNKKPAVRLTLSPAVVSAEIGKPQYIRVRVNTENTPPAYYELRAKPDPRMHESWYTLPAGQHIPGDGTHTFDFILSMPTVGTIGNATHEIALQVIANNPAIPSAYQVLKIRIIPFTRFNITLKPNEVSDNRRRRADLTITNTGNHTESFSIEAQTPDTLQIVPQTRQTQIEAGQEKSIHLQFKPARGARRQRTRLIYTLIVHTTSGLSERVNGSYTFPHRRRYPIQYFILWALVVFIIGRWLLLGDSLTQQWNEVRLLIELLILKLRGV